MKTQGLPTGGAGRGAGGRAGLVRIAIWFAVVAGLGQALLLGLGGWWFGRILHQSPDVVWMAPLANVALYVPLALLLALAAKRWPAWVTPERGVFVFAFLSIWGPLTVVPRLHRYAALALALGLASQAARLVGGRASGFFVVVRHTTATLVIAAVSLGVGLYGWRALSERSALASLPAAEPGAPNLLFIVLDTVRAKSMSAYGYARPTTPRIDELAKTGVLFERPLSTSPWTLTSHVSMFTGRFPHEVTADWLTPFDGQHPTLAEVLRTRGYVTAGFVANMLYTTAETGINRGFIHYEDYPVTPGMVVRSSWLVRMVLGWVRRAAGDQQKLVRKSAEELNRDALAWLSARDRRPFFVFLNYFDAHAPYLPPPPFDTKFGPKARQYDLAASPRRWSAAEIQPSIDAYDGCLAYADHHVGRFLDALRSEGVLDDTLVVITSDHGEQFGENDLFEHANSLYRPLLDVPLVIRLPRGAAGGRRVREPVTLADLPATVMDVVAGGPAPFPGRSLARHWGATAGAGRDQTALVSAVSRGINIAPWVPVSRGGMQSLVRDGLHYIRNDDGREELYDFEQDPDEERDLAREPEGGTAVRRYREMLDTIIAQKRDAAPADVAVRRGDPNQ